MTSRACVTLGSDVGGSGSSDGGGGSVADGGSVAKLSAAGEHVWSQRYGDAAIQCAAGCYASVDADGNVFSYGSFDGAMSFGGGNLSAGASFGGATLTPTLIDGYLVSLEP